MKRKILLIILGLLLLSQVPFAYRRYRLRSLQTTIQQLATQRAALSAEGEFVDYKGVIHVHSALGGHSTGNFSELISAAKANQLDFVIMTEHPQADFDTSELTLNGLHGGVLFVNGNEVVTADGVRLLLIPGAANASEMNNKSTQQIIDQQKASGALAIAAYPTESQGWQSSSVDGVEVYNLFTNARSMNPLVLFFDGVWSYRGYGDLMFANFFARPSGNLKQWDDATANGNRKLIATAGNDAHSNVGVSLNDSTGKQLIGIKLDPYERSFRTVRTHVLIKKDRGLSRDSLLEAISQGHCYIAFDLFSAADGFRFAAINSNKIMGDEISLSGQLKLDVRTALPSRVVLLKNGNPIAQSSASPAEFPVDGAGTYRVEVYLDALPAPAKGQPWIISNPIYVR
jgi:hypothetical protein